MNLGLSEKLSYAFPEVVPVEIPIVELPITIHPEWLAGFTSAEGCFYIVVTPSKNKTGYQVKLCLQVTQHSRDKLLLILISKILKCGHVTKNRNAFDYRVTKFSGIETKIIPLFKKHPIRGVKAQDFAD